MATDSQAAIGRTKNLETERHKGWIEERAGAGGGKMLTWVKGRSGVLGNEVEDLRAKSKHGWEQGGGTRI